VKKAFPLKSMTYEEAMELPTSAQRLFIRLQCSQRWKEIPIRIKNTFNPSFEGTLINGKSNTHNFSIKGISSIDEIALLRVQGGGMVGVAGIAQRIFSALAGKRINIILITQASSEHSLCIAVLPKVAALAKSYSAGIILRNKEKLVNEPVIESDLSIIAVVGENMRKTPGISGRVSRR